MADIYTTLSMGPIHTAVRPSAKIADILVTPDEIRALATSPKVIVPAPLGGSGSAHIFHWGYFDFNYQSVAHGGPTNGDCLFRYNTGTGQVVSDTVDMNGKINATVDWAWYVPPLVADYQIIPGGTIVLDNNGTNFTGSGDTSLRVVVYYSTISTLRT